MGAVQKCRSPRRSQGNSSGLSDERNRTARLLPRTLQQDSKAAINSSVVGEMAQPTGRSTVVIPGKKTPTANHMLRSRFGASRVGHWSLIVTALIMVATPLPHIPVHVEHPPTIWLAPRDGMRHVVGVTFGPGKMMQLVRLLNRSIGTSRPSPPALQDILDKSVRELGASPRFGLQA